MNTGYEFIIGLRDMASATLQKIGGGVAGLHTGVQKTTSVFTTLQGKTTAVFSKLYTSAKSTIAPTKQLSASVDELRNKLDKINKVRFSTTLKKEFESATREAQKLEKQIKRLEQGISGNGIRAKIRGWQNDFESSLPGADLIKNPVMLASAAVGGIWVATQSAMEAGKEKVKLQTLTGSAEIGEALYEGLTKFATDTVFGTELYDMANQMLANGIHAGDVMPLMKQLGDISMGDAQKLGSLSLALAQVQGKGNLAGQELLQLVNAGFNPLQVISEKTGESMSSLKDKMEKGEISFDDVRRAMDMATGEGGKFYKMLDKVADTPFGQFENFKGQLDQIMVRIGTVFIPIASKLLKFFSSAIDFLGPFIEPLAIGIGVLSVGILGLAAAQWAWNLAMSLNPIGLIIMGIVALVAAIAYCIYNIEGWGKAWKHTTEGVKLLFQGFVANIEAMWNTAINSLMIGLNKIKEGWYKFKNAVGLGDENENNALLKSIAQDTENRKKQITEGVKNATLLNAQSVSEFQKVGQSLSWKGKSFSDVKDNIAGKFLAPQGSKTSNEEFTNTVGKNTIGNGIGKNKTDSILSGGSRQTNITINIDKVGTDTKIYVSSKEEGLSALGERIREELLRAVNSVNQFQTG